MKKSALLELSKAVSTFSLKDAPLDLRIRIIKFNQHLNELSESISKQLKDLYASYKQVEFDALNEDLKKLLAEKEPKMDKINILQIRINLLVNEQIRKHKEAEEAVGNEDIKVNLEKITEDEMDILTKPKEELVDMEKGMRKVVEIDNFSPNMLTAILPMLKQGKENKTEK